MDTNVYKSQSRPRSSYSSIKASKIVMYAVTIILALLWLFPLWLTITIAIKSTSDFTNSPFWFLPREFNLFQNIADAWNSASLGQGFTNSLFYGVGGAGLAVLIASLASYGLVVLKFAALFSGFWLFSAERCSRFSATFCPSTRCITR